MEIHKTLQPGQPGTKKYVRQYGESLVCVRYRYDVTTKIRYKTVELIVGISQGDAFKKNGGITSEKNNDQFDEMQYKDVLNGDDILFVRIGYDENELRKRIKASGGIWNPEKKLWEISYSDISALGLSDRIVQEKM